MFFSAKLDFDAVKILSSKKNAGSANEILGSAHNRLTESPSVCLWKNLNDIPHEGELFPMIKDCSETPPSNANHSAYKHQR